MRTRGWPLAGRAPLAARDETVGVVVNAAVAGFDTVEDRDPAAARRAPVSPYFVPSSLANMPACEVAIDLGVHGPVLASALACASGSDALLGPAS